MTRAKLDPAQVITIWCAVAATYLATSMGGAVSLVLPGVASELSLSSSQAQWILAGYLLARVGMLRPAGTLCDWLGARKVFLMGMFLFAGTSLGCALAHGEDFLIPFRVLQGAAAAVLSTSSLLLLRNNMPSEELARATSIWSFAGIAGFGLSPVFGGLMVSAWGWQSIFYFCAAATALFALVFLTSKADAPATTAPASPRPPIEKELLMSTALVALAYLIGQNDIKGALYFLAAAFAITLVIERGGMLRLSVWQADLPRLPIMLAGLAGFAAIGAVVLWSAYFIQVDLNRSVLEYGLMCLPMAIAGTVSCLVAKPLITSKRADIAFLFGGISVVAMAGFAFRAEAQTSEMYAAIALACGGLCYGFINASLSAAMMDTFPPAQSGDASAIASLSKQFGQLVGVAMVAQWRSLSSSATVSDMLWFFLLMGGCGGVMLVCAALRAAGRRGSGIPYPASR